MYEWKLLHELQDEATTLRCLDSLKAFKVAGSGSRRCQVCAVNMGNHKMQYRLLQCKSSTCKFGFRQVDCPCWYKLLVCKETHAAVLFQHETHNSLDLSPTKPTFSKEAKAFAVTLVEQDVKPSRILHEIQDRYNYGRHQGPTLQMVQNFAKYVRKSRLDNSDSIDKMIAKAASTMYKPNMNEDEAFTFGYSLDDQGQPCFGDGSDSDPFFIGISSVALMKKVAHDESKYVFHMDATFKLNLLDYPVMVCGVSDLCRAFHVVAVFVVSQRTTRDYRQALYRLKEMCEVVNKKPLQVKYFMGDAEQAQLNAARSCFEDATYLMCFFHVMAKVKEKCAGMTVYSRHLAMRCLYDMHFAREEAAFIEARRHALQCWSAQSDMSVFVNYFTSQWLSPPFDKWQAFHSDAGFAATNNPVEQFNGLIKRDYTMRKRQKLVQLVKSLISMCRHQSINYKVFQTEVRLTTKVINRFDDMMEADYVRVECVDRGSLAFIMRNEDQDVVHVRSHRQLIVAGEGNDDDFHDARMEVAGQPETGWPVDMKQKHCQCLYFHKYGCCIHLYAACIVLSVPVPGVDTSARVFVSRKPSKRTLQRRPRGTAAGDGAERSEADGEGNTYQGRPATVGPAYSHQ